MIYGKHLLLLPEALGHLVSVWPLGDWGLSSWGQFCRHCILMWLTLNRNPDTKAHWASLVGSTLRSGEINVLHLTSARSGQLEAYPPEFKSVWLFFWTAPYVPFPFALVFYLSLCILPFYFCHCFLYPLASCDSIPIASPLWGKMRGTGRKREPRIRGTVRSWIGITGWPFDWVLKQSKDKLCR